jgi:site-specific DNA-cytosine methylase
MTSDEKAQKINEIYEDAIRKLEVLKQKRRDIIKQEITKAEAEEVEKIRASLSTLSNNQ